MKNKSLAKDYLKRCQCRLVALKTLLDQKSWADVVRGAQEIVELALKGLLRKSGIEVPWIHDVSGILLENEKRIPSTLHDHLQRIVDISRDLRRDRELAFYGSEDLTPSEFYQQKDAEKAYANATWVVDKVSAVVLKDE